MKDFSLIFTSNFIKDFRYLCLILGGANTMSYWHFRMRCEGVNCILVTKISKYVRNLIKRWILQCLSLSDCSFSFDDTITFQRSILCQLFFLSWGNHTYQVSWLVSKSTEILDIFTDNKTTDIFIYFSANKAPELKVILKIC